VVHVDPAGHLTIANAGHLAPYLDGEELALENGLPLGIAASATYRESTFSLRPNARLTLMTDGVVEARSGSGELFGFDRARHQPPLRRIDRRRSRAIRPGRRHHRPDLAACQINR
jgi:serine phosphatase RsbU (regulator of sigma subunit)